jgi:hypothetical protein
MASFPVHLLPSPKTPRVRVANASRRTPGLARAPGLDRAPGLARAPCHIYMQLANRFLPLALTKAGLPGLCWFRLGDQ